MQSSDLIAAQNRTRTVRQVTTHGTPKTLRLLTAHGVPTFHHGDTWDAGEEPHPCPTGCIGHYAGDEPFFPGATSETAIRAKADGELGSVTVFHEAEGSTPSGTSRLSWRLRFLIAENIYAFARPTTSDRESELIFMVDVAIAWAYRAVFAFKSLDAATALYDAAKVCLADGETDND